MNLMRLMKTGLCLTVLVCCGAAFAQSPSTQTIQTNFKDADIQEVARAVAELTHRNFIIDPRVRAQVNLISSTPMTPNEFYQAFLSILQVHGFAAVPSGNVIKIVPDANVRTVPGNDLPDRTGNTDEMVTQVVTAKNINAAQLAQVLRPLTAQYGNLAPVPGTNTLIITDRASNVSRIMRIIARVDQASDSNIEIIPLQNSTAADIVRTLSALTTGQAAPDGGGLPPRIVADERSNSVLLSGEAGWRLRTATMIAHLDTPIENGGDTQVHFLRYADAEKIAPKLKEQLTATTAAAGGAAATTSVDRSTSIWADAETNALIITAPPKTMRSLLTIIDRLDFRRAQVLVEAIIVDVSTDKSADLGVNWAVFSKENGTSVPAGGFIQKVAGASIVDLAAGIINPSAAALATAPSGTTFGIGRLRDTGVNFGAMIRALRSDANTNVIATPTTTTMDNQEAELEVAKEVPFLTGQFTSTGGNNNGSVNPFSTVQRQKVGTILKITPQINGGDAMMLKIELESSELSGEAGDAGSLVTNTRKIKTNVLIEDDGTVVIGGLIRDSKTGGESRVPYLGRIPLIGEAFKVRNGKRNKSNLMVFIHVKILADGVQTAIESNAKYNAIRSEQINQRDRGEILPIIPFDNAPRLPPARVPAPAPAPDAPAPKIQDKSADAGKAP
jgi:general secretion pathway protein D